MSTVIIGIGLPGSGKTTVLKPLAESMDAVYICLDDIRKELTGDATDQSRNPEVGRIGKSRTARAIQAGKDVVFDATNAKRPDRRALTKLCRQSGATKVSGLYFKPPTMVAVERNHSRGELAVPDLAVGRMLGWLEARPPSVDDGFDMIEVYDK